MEPNDTLAALDANYLDTNRIFMESAETGEYVERGGVAIMNCGLPVEELNWGFLEPPFESPFANTGKLAADVRAYFDERKLPFEVRYRDADGHPCAAALEAAGWRRKADPAPGMTLSLPVAMPEPPEDVEIDEVRSPEALLPFRAAAFEGFGYPVAAAHLFLNEHLLAAGGVRFFSGRVDGAVVATSMLVRTGRVAGIYWVATLDAHRGRGFGEALTWAAVAAGQEAGCDVASLQASKLGRPVYERMGFAHVLDYVGYLPPE